MKPKRGINYSHLLKTWFWVSGFFAFLWLVLRSGMNPKRLTYPCQQALYPLASSWFIALLAFTGGSYLLMKYLRFSLIALTVIFSVFFLFVATENNMANEFGSYFQNSVEAPAQLAALPVWEVSKPVSSVFVMNNIPKTSGSLNAANASVPQSYMNDPAIDTLLLIMQRKGIYLNKTAEHATGIVGADNVVIIKANLQWDSQCSTSTDRIKGLINQIVNHLDGFSGEIIVCDNTQDLGSGINERDNNSEDTNQSIIDVVNTFKAKGYPVYLLNWNTMYNDVATEYSQNDMNNGYVYESSTKISYPKFRTTSGKYYVSLRYGIWDNASKTYDKNKLCIVDFPVLKAHSVAGATIAVKNWVGVLTTAHSTERYGGFWPMHNDYFFSSYALIAKVMAVTYPKLCIVDAAWTNTRVGNDLSALSKTNSLLASTDPVAVDWYAAKYILTPVAQSPQTTNPDLEGGTFHNNLKYWSEYLHTTAGFPCTMNANEISVYDRSVLKTVTGVSDISSETGLKLKCYNTSASNLRVEFLIPNNSIIELRIIDILGRSENNVVKESKSAGSYTIDYNTSALKKGFYLVTLSNGSKSITQKIIL